MKKTVARLAVFAIIATAFIVPLAGGPANAANCAGIGTTTSAGGRAYVNNRGGGSIWIYVESNNIAGLQTGSAKSLGISEEEDGCETTNPDTLVF